MFRNLCQARDLLCEVHEPPLTIEDVARAVRMSPFHFSRRFESLFGATPHQLRIQWRLDRAKYLLAQGEHSVTEVCMEVGFSSLGSFSDLFSRRVGETPSNYRRRVRTLVQMPAALAVAPGCLSLMAHLPPGAFRGVSQFSRSPPALILAASRPPPHAPHAR